MAGSIFWYDFETTGIQPSRDRPLQVAGVRTTEALEEVGEPLNLYCRLAEDILPHPAACLVTGIHPHILEEQGVPEPEFMDRLHQALSQPGTCSAGYNTLRFDDEVVRYGLYRNFFDPYAREWQSGNSRWDLIDLVRTAYALRPEGLCWPEEQGRVTLKLEALTAANGLEHSQAHDALSDVRATLALARLIRTRQPRLFDYLYQLRQKAQVVQKIQLLEPMVHVSGRFSAERHYLSVVLPLAWHPVDRNALIVCDLLADSSPLWQESAEELHRRLYTRREALAAHELPVPLKLIHINRCPVIAPLSVLRPQDTERLGIVATVYQDRAQQLLACRDIWQPKLTKIYTKAPEYPEVTDPEQKLYSGFIGNADRQLCEQLRRADASELAMPRWVFQDARLTELLFRYRARNFPQTLSVQEQQRWRTFCQSRLTNTEAGAPMTCASFRQQVRELLQSNLDAKDQTLLEHWEAYVKALEIRYELV